MQTEPKARQAAEEKMKAEWQRWTQDHASNGSESNVKQYASEH
jgi:hypothetical protein